VTEEGKEGHGRKGKGMEGGERTREVEGALTKSLRGLIEALDHQKMCPCVVAPICGVIQKLLE